MDDRYSSIAAYFKVNGIKVVELKKEELRVETHWLDLHTEQLLKSYEQTAKEVRDIMMLTREQVEMGGYRMTGVTFILVDGTRKFIPSTI